MATPAVHPRRRQAKTAEVARRTAEVPWYRQCYRRLLVDIHIPEWDEAFLSQLDAERYVETIAESRARGIMLYCNSHVGLALYPSQVGPRHRVVQHGDFVGDVLKAARKRGLQVVAYYSAVYNNAAFLAHPDWRIRPLQGEVVYEASRYGTCCPNSPYSEFATRQTAEFCSLYEFDGVFFDMLFWPYVCYCPHCERRFWREDGTKLPPVINWHDPVWMAFQRARERWMGGLAEKLTATVRELRPSMSVTHQMSPVLHGWRTAMPYALTEHCDYASGDFYGPPIQQSVVCKIFEAISKRKPFEFMTSRCVNLWDHVTTKDETEMAMQAFLAPAHAAAFMFIDAIDPVGTLSRDVHERIGGVFEQLEPYEPFLGGELAAEVAIYVSSESRFDFRENDTPVGASSRRADNMTSEAGMPHMAAVFGAARSLQESHIPYAVVTNLDLDRLKNYRVVLLPDVLVMSDDEIEALRDFVASGGSLYASGHSSLVAGSGVPRNDFGLADVFGVSATDMMDDRMAFVSPTHCWMQNAAMPQTHLIHRGGWIPVKVTSAQKLADLTLPWCDEAAGTVLRPSFASIHSSPPGPKALQPAITWKRHGEGWVCYSAAPIEAGAAAVNRRMVAEIVRRLHAGTLPVTADAPPSIEITAYDKKDQKRLNISLVSLRQQEEPVACSGSVRVRLGKERRIVGVKRLPGREPQPVRRIPGGIEFFFDDLRIFSLYEIQYR